MEHSIVLVRDLNTRQCQTSGRPIPAVSVVGNCYDKYCFYEPKNTHHSIYKIQGLKLRPKKHSANLKYMNAQLLIWHTIPN